MLSDLPCPFFVFLKVSSWVSNWRSFTVLRLMLSLCHEISEDHLLLQEDVPCMCLITLLQHSDTFVHRLHHGNLIKYVESNENHTIAQSKEVS